MIYTIIIASIMLLSLYFYVIGYGTKLLLKLQMSHNLVLGMFSYGILFGIVATPLAVLHVSWNLFFGVITGLNIFILGSSLYLMYKQKEWPVWSLKKIKEYVISYWPIILLVVLYLLIYLMNDYAFTWHGDHGAVWDHSYYASKANAAINSSHILQINPKNGTIENPMSMLVNSTVTWELFWSYLSSITGLTINQISKLILPFFIYIGIFFSYEAIFSSLFANKKCGKFYRGYIAVFLTYLIYTTANSDLQGELKKLLYFPWYGNVQITILFMLTTFYFFHRALSDKKWIVVLILQLIFYSVFSAGAAMYAGLMYPWFMIYWLFKKSYKFKFDKILVLLGLVGFAGINVFYIRSQATVPYIEQEVWINHLNLSTPMFLLASAGITILSFQKKLEETTFFLIVFIVFSIAVLLLGPTSTKVFLWYRFALHRYGVSLMLLFLMIGSCGLFYVCKFDKKTIIIMTLPGLILMQKNYDFFLEKNRSSLNPAHILNINRESDEVVSIAQFLNKKAKEKNRSIYYCMYSNNAAITPTLTHQFSTNYPDRFLNIGSMILTETRNVYETSRNNGVENVALEVADFTESNCDYTITDSEGLKNYYTQKGAQIEHTVSKNDLLTRNIYIIDIEGL